MASLQPDFNEYPPDCWSDDVRMRALMAMFRNRDANAHGYDIKMKFWKQTIADSCAHFNDPIVSVRDLVKRFRRRDTKPLCLPDVLKDMLRDGLICSIEEYQSGNQGWMSYAINTLSWIASPVSWVLWGSNAGASSSGVPIGSPGQMGGYDSDTTRYVVKRVVEKIANDIVDHYWRHQEEDVDVIGPPPPITYSCLSRLVQPVCASNEALDLALCYLKQKSLIAEGTTKDNERLFKFIEDGSEHTEMTDLDKAVLNIRQASHRIEQELENLEKEMERLDLEVRRLIRAGNKSKAKTVLRKKKLVEKAHIEKGNSHAKLQDMLIQLQNTHSQKKIMNALKGGVDAFKANNMSLDSVDTTVDMLHEVLSDQEEINSAIGTPMGANTFSANDMDTLEDELEELIAETNIEKRRQIVPDSPDMIPNGAHRLPDIPSPASTSRPAATSTPLEYARGDSGAMADGPSPVKQSRVDTAAPKDRLAQLRKQLEAA